MTEFNKRLFTSIFLLVVIYFSFLNNLILSGTLIIIAYIALNEFNNIFLKIFYKNKLLNLIILFISLIYVIFFCLIVWIFLLTNNDENRILLLFILSVCISSDIGGYCFGKILKGKKLTKISPNKTYSGMIGSFVFSIIISSLFFNKIDTVMNIILLTIIISILSQIGDLFISYLKRKAKLKDTGSFLPGHGGILDRIDGILLAVPLGIILATL